jgi:GST-like protein
MSDRYKLFCVRGYGSMIVEAAFAHADIEIECVDLTAADAGWDSAVLAKYNPLGQIPTLLMPDGSVLTETSAIILHIADVKPACGLAPPADHPGRVKFLRWLMMLAGPIYSTFTYGDNPGRWLAGDDETGKKLRTQTDETRKLLFREMEKHAGAPWFLGETFSAIDLYLWSMTYWRPRRAWFAQETPALSAIALKADALEVCRAVQRRNGLLK